MVVHFAKSVLGIRLYMYHATKATASMVRRDAFYQLSTVGFGYHMYHGAGYMQVLCISPQESPQNCGFCVNPILLDMKIHAMRASTCKEGMRFPRAVRRLQYRNIVFPGS